MRAKYSCILASRYLFSLLHHAIIVIGKAPPGLALFIAAGVLLLVFTCCYPVVLVYLLFYAGGTTGFWVFGLLAAAGSVAECFVMSLSQAAFGFGGYASTSPVTIYYWLIPGIHMLLALASIAIGFSSKAAGLVAMLLGRV